ncbi:MAG: TIGR03960 family B12-binding radical SAM protein [Planctomycetota bacterium]
MNLTDILHRDILIRVEKPSRYLGSEVNSIRKTGREVSVRLALVFPDLYDLGLGNLGLHILYARLNELDWCWAERAYAPALDMEAALRERGLPLFTNESKDSLALMDGIGFTLQSELTYTNILNIIDLAGIPLRTDERDDRHPLTFAGGPSVFNPEPLAPFMDFFVMGDGEKAVVELAEVLRDSRDLPRREKLERISRLKGFYVPALYPTEILSDGRVMPAEAAPKIVKRVERDLDAAPFPSRPIVPFTHQVHDRMSLEVLRGCTQGCRFCQAGMTTRPVRERSLESNEHLMERGLRSTGYEEVSLVSLSTCDYSRVRTLVDRAAAYGQKERVAVSLPSLRLDSFSVDLADRITAVRRSGLTFAPEAGSARLRALINKWTADEELLSMAREALKRGWNHLKLYFMIGLPTETDDDIEAIADLTLRVLAAGREVNRRARVHIGVSTFVPKPFTPFQWAPQITREETERRQAILLARLRRHRAVHFGRHAADETFIEGLVSRSDRRCADLLEAAFRRGARFDAWTEHRKMAAWNAAIDAVGYDAEGQLRARELDERLPWDHIDVLVSKEWLAGDWRRALALGHARDCRQAKCHKCGVIDAERPLCAQMLRQSIQGRRAEREWKAIERPFYKEPPAVQRLRVRIGRYGEARFLSHLEMMTAWIRALRRARLPLSHSQGFHAHARVNFSMAAPVGEASEDDFMDVFLKERVEPAEIEQRLEAVKPEGFHVYGAAEVPLKGRSLMSLVQGCRYEMRVPGADAIALGASVRALLETEALPVERRAKTGGGRAMAVIDVRPLVTELAVREDGAVAVIDLITRASEGRLAKCREILQLLGVDPHAALVVKKETYLAEESGGSAAAG